MIKFLKITLITIICLFLIIAVGGYIFLKNVDFNRYKNLAEDMVTQATGRQFNIGEVRIQPSFNPTVRLQGVKFANASWSKNPNMATIGSIDVGVALIPLLEGNYVINKFVIRDAVINLEEDKTSGANWEFSPIEDNTQKATEEENISFRFNLISEAYAEETEDSKNTSSDINSLLSSIVIKQVAFENVKINYTDKEAKTQSYDVHSLTLDENREDNIDFTFNVNDGLYKGKGVLGALSLLESEAGYPVEANVSVMGIDVNTDIKLFDVLGNIRFDGQVLAKGFLGKDSLYNESADVMIKGDLKNVVAVINSISVAGNVVTGQVNAQLENSVPTIEANLNSDKIDLASFKPKHQAVLGFSFIREAEATTMVSNDEIPYDVLKLVNADARLKISQIVNGTQNLAKNIDIQATVNNGNAVVRILDGNIAQGTVKADVSLSQNKTFKLKADIVKLNILNLLEVLQVNSESFNFVSGSNTDLYVNLSGKGNTYAAVTESLDGQVALIMDESKLHLGNIGLLKGNIISQLLNTLQLVKEDDDLTIGCAVVRADFKDGLAVMPNGIVINADKFTVVANGDINLKNDKIGISIKPFGGKLTDTNIAKALSSLVKLTGTLSEPKIGVDAANAAKNIIGATLTGPVYLGAQMAMESDSSPCYTALKGTGYESRFPESQNIVQSTGGDVSKAINDSVGMVKDTAKSLLNMFSGKSDK